MDREEKRFDIAMEAVKQQIALASVIITVLSALLVSKEATFQISASFFLFLACILSGVVLLMTIPYVLYSKDDPFGSTSVRVLGAVQSLLFFIGITVLGSSLLT